MKLVDDFYFKRPFLGIFLSPNKQKECFQELRLEPEDGADDSAGYEDGSPDYFSPGKGR